MKRPDFVTNEQINRWSDALEKDKFTPAFFKETDLLREIMYAGFWLLEELETLECEELLITRIQFTHGAMSYGNDCWKIANDLLIAYKNNELEFLDEEGIKEDIEEIIKIDVPRDQKVQN